MSGALPANRTVTSGVAPVTHRRRARGLYLGFNVKFINPTRQLLKDALAQCCDLVLFGPGYCSIRDVERGPEEFASRHGPFDFAIADEYAVLRPGSVPREKRGLHRFKNHACRFDPKLLYNGMEYYAFLRKFRGPRIISLLQSDYYNFSEQFIATMEEIADFYVCWGSEFLSRKSGQTVIGLHDLNRYVVERWNDNYFEFACRNASRIISTPHFVAADEICAAPLSARQYPWSVLGADYDARITVRDALRRADLQIGAAALPYLFAAAQRLHLNLYNKHSTIWLLNCLFRSALRHSRYSFTCGGALRWPIRKFVEIPANGCVLVAESCHGFEALGFEDCKNAVACAPEDVFDVHAWLESDRARAQRIADAGRKLIMERHTVAARAVQLGDSLERILAGSFCGSIWQGGNFTLYPTPENQAHACRQ